MNLLDGADGSIANPFHRLPDPFGRMTLIPHLRHSPRFFGNFSDKTSFRHVMRQWLFTVNMLPFSHGVNRNIRVEMIGGGAQDGVNS